MFSSEGSFASTPVDPVFNWEFAVGWLVPPGTLLHPSAKGFKGVNICSFPVQVLMGYGKGSY